MVMSYKDIIFSNNPVLDDIIKQIDSELNTININGVCNYINKIQDGFGRLQIFIKGHISDYNISELSKKYTEKGWPSMCVSNEDNKIIKISWWIPITDINPPPIVDLYSRN